MKKTIENTLNIIFTNYEKNKKKNRKTTRININSCPRKLIHLTNYQCQILGKCYQFLIDSSKNTIETLSKLTDNEIEKHSDDLKYKIKSGYFKHDGYDYPECQCGRIENCSKCGRYYCGKTQSDYCPHGRGY
jgi:hypothetical protein